MTAVEKPSTDEIFLEEAPPATQAHDTAASDAEIDAMLQESLASPESDPATTATESASQIIITSELEVSD